MLPIDSTLKNVLFTQFTNVLTLGSIEVPDNIIAEAENWGVQEALDIMHRENLLAQPSFAASAAITIMEELHKHGFKEKVWIYARHLAEHVAQALQNNTQKAEFYIRVACLLSDQDRLAFRNLAVDLLYENYKVIPCPSHALIKLAQLFAETRNVEHAIFWLTQAQASRDQFQEITEIFFKQGLFQEGLRLLESSSEGWSNTFNSENYIELLALGLKHKAFLSSYEYQTALDVVALDPDKALILIKWYCHTGAPEKALKCATALCLTKDTIFYLLQFSRYMVQTGSPNNYISEIREVISLLSNPVQAVKDICRSGQYSISEDIQTYSLLKDLDCKIDILWERVCGITNKYPLFNDKLTAEDQSDISRLLSTMSDNLKLSQVYLGHPPYWLQVMHTYVRYGLYIEALQVGEHWKAWHANLEASNTDFSKSLWCFSFLGMFKIVAGCPSEGLSDLKMAYQLQLTEWEKHPQCANNFYHLVHDAIRVLSPGVKNGQLSGCDAHFFNRIKLMQELNFEEIQRTLNF